jgi:hypothetical protein
MLDEQFKEAREAIETLEAVNALEDTGSYSRKIRGVPKKEKLN